LAQTALLKVLAGPPTPVEMRLFSVGSNSSFESASSDNSEPLRIRSFSDIDLTRSVARSLKKFRPVHLKSSASLGKSSANFQKHQFHNALFAVSIKNQI
jgi:hypothetical protein